MDSDLERYLNDHLAGSAGAVNLIDTLVDAADDPQQADFFRNLKIKVEEDRKLLKDLLGRIDCSDSGILQVAGNLTARAGRLKFMWEGLEPGRLGMLEALELLCIGIHGKRLLWVMLGNLSPWIREWSSEDFAALELEAIAQRDAVEEFRIQAGLDALIDGERRSGVLP